VVLLFDYFVLAFINFCGLILSEITQQVADELVEVASGADFVLILPSLESEAIVRVELYSCGH
jgi:hypothetical protein